MTWWYNACLVIDGTQVIVKFYIFMKNLKISSMELFD